MIYLFHSRLYASLDQNKKKESPTGKSITNEKSIKLAKEFVHMSAIELDRASRNQMVCATTLNISSETSLMVKCVKEVQKLNNGKMECCLVSNMKKIVPSFRLDNGKTIIQNIAAEMYGGRINWGRIVSLHYFVFLIMKELKLEGRLTSKLEKAISIWLGDCLVELSNWIENQHDTGDGWLSFEINFKSFESATVSFIITTINTVVGFGLLSYCLYR